MKLIYTCVHTSGELSMYFSRCGELFTDLCKSPIKEFLEAEDYGTGYAVELRREHE